MTKEQMRTTGYHGALLDVYHYMRCYVDRADDSETFWNAAATEAFNISRKYEDTTVSGFVNALLSACYDELKAIRDRNTEAQNPFLS